MADAKLSALPLESLPALTDETYVVDAGLTSQRVTLDRFFGLLPTICDGRLTTESGVPVSSSDRTAQGTIYFTPYLGGSVALYDGTRWRMYAFAEVSLALAVTSGKNYDVFLYDNAGTLTLELSAAWTNDTTRADALARQNNIFVKSGTPTRRWVGTIRASGANVTADSQVQRFVWNAYNQVPRSCHATEATGHTYNVAAWREWRGGGGNVQRQEIILGAAQDFMLYADGSLTGVTGANTDAIGVQMDGTDGSTGGAINVTATGITALYHQAVRAALGYHFITAVELGDATGAATFSFYRNDFTIVN